MTKLTVETIPPNRVIIRGRKNEDLQLGEAPPRRFIRTFLLPSNFSIDKIVAYLSPEEVLTVTTDPSTQEGQSEVPIYCNDCSDVV